MTSSRARPEPAPLDELERLVAALEDELMALRARTQAAGRVIGPDREQTRQRIGLLESENQLLRQRIAAAREQVERLRTRLRFIEDRAE